MNEETGTNVLPEGGDVADAPSLDEATFIKKARRRSTRRILLLSGGLTLAAVIVLAAIVVLWNWRLNAEAERIDSYYCSLVPVAYPNTRIMLPGTTRSRFPGAVNEYTAYRTVGDVIVPAGEVSVEFDVWGGEQFRGVFDDRGYGDSLARGDNGRRFVSSQPARALGFLAPAGAAHAKTESTDLASSQPESVAQEEELLGVWAAETASSLSRLSSAPPDSTVEMAVSFDGTISLAEVESLLGQNVELLWGATWVYSDDAQPWELWDAHLVGVDFTWEVVELSGFSRTHQDAEDDLVETLRSIAKRAPDGTAYRCSQSAGYLEQHGVRYFGVVVCGHPKAALALAHNPSVSAVSLGFVVMPWE
ncbi:MAG: anti sigma factor C-terminal domain-containing protein [Thermoleophilia bacterium]|nr:anti sigma factor C-terminal domain-containing protein [Thermoleophilia bacterium]